MRRRNLTANGFALLLGVALMHSALATPAFAEVNINVNIGAPPPIVVQQRPTMVYLAEPGMFVAVGVPYDVYFISGRYYYFHGDNWFWASGYGGPWVHVTRKSLPPGLQKYKVVQLRDFRDREYKVYKAQGPKFKGQKFSAEPGMAKSHKGESVASSPGNSGGGNGNGKGKGRGR
ncbi:MAG TPA: hypothetical protein VFR18_23330 [Terriglobia bacterium]|nr:hypothetical protein [Terriglobia bacterium]